MTTNPMKLNVHKQKEGEIDKNYDTRHWIEINISILRIMTTLDYKVFWREIKKKWNLPYDFGKTLIEKEGSCHQEKKCIHLCLCFQLQTLTTMGYVYFQHVPKMLTTKSQKWYMYNNVFKPTLKTQHWKMDCGVKHIWNGFIITWSTNHRDVWNVF